MEGFESGEDESVVLKCVAHRFRYFVRQSAVNSLCEDACRLGYECFGLVGGELADVETMFLVDKFCYPPKEVVVELKGCVLVGKLQGVLLV